MGPLASAEFLRDILDRIPVRKDWDYPRIILDSHPHIPSRSRCWLYKEASPYPGMLEACRKLEQYNVQYIAIPCNSAQCWLTELQAELNTPILDIRDITVEALCKSFPSVKEAIVFGSAVTIGMESYLPYLDRRGISYVKPDAALQEEVENFIELAKANIARDILFLQLKSLLAAVESPSRAVILGCTEFGLIRNELSHISCPVIDSLSAYAAKCATLFTKPFFLPQVRFP